MDNIKSLEHELHVYMVLRCDLFATCLLSVPFAALMQLPSVLLEAPFGVRIKG